MLDAAGVDPITAEELTVIPGAEEVLALLELRRHVLSGAWDVVVVVDAPTAETLRLLALPEALKWYMDRMFGVQRRVVRALRPVLSRTAGVPMPEDAVFDAVQRLHADHRRRTRLLTAAGASVRLVLTPEKVVVAEARRSLTTLSLYGYRVDGVVANRVFPDSGDDPWRAGWVAAQSGCSPRSRSPSPGCRCGARASPPPSPSAVDDLVAFAEAAYDGHDPLAVPRARADDHHQDGVGCRAAHRTALRPAQRRRPRPARRRARRDGGSYRRLLALPAALRRHR